MKKKPILFLSTHRCGTKGLADFFEYYYPLFHSVHQPAFSRRINIATTLRIHDTIGNQIFSDVCLKRKLKQIESSTSEVYVETNGFNLLLAKLIADNYTDTKLVHIVRDPRTWVISYMNWTKSRPKSKFAYKFIPFWNIDASKLGYMSKQEWAGLEEYQKFCWWWKIKNDIIIEKYSKDSRYIRFRFEDLYLSQNTEYVKSLIDFMGLDYTNEMPDFFQKKRNISQSIYKKEEFWNKERLDSLKTIVGPDMEFYNYE